MNLLANKKVGVDLGATAVRVAEVVGVDPYGFAVVRRAVVVPLKEGSIVAGEVKNPVVLGQALAFALKQAGVPRQGFVLGASSRFAALGGLDSPTAVAVHERTNQIRLSRHEISPTVPVEDSAVSWNTVEGHPAAPGHMHLNVALMLHKSVEDLQKVCKIAGAMPQAIDLVAAGSLRSMVRVHPGDATVATVVDVGASKTAVITRHGMHLRSLRTVASGGSLITRALMGAEELTFDEAEQRKRYIRLNKARTAQGVYGEVSVGGDTQRTDGELAVQSSVDQLIEEIAKSVASDAQAHGGIMTQGVQLTGGGSRIPGFAERLQLRLGVPVVVAKPWIELQQNKHTAALFTNGQPDAAAVSDIAAAVGLALWKSPS